MYYYSKLNSCAMKRNLQRSNPEEYFHFTVLPKKQKKNNASIFAVQPDPTKASLS